MKEEWQLQGESKSKMPGKRPQYLGISTRQSVSHASCSCTCALDSHVLPPQLNRSVSTHLPGGREAVREGEERKKREGGKEREGGGGRERERQTDRQTETETDRQTDKERQRDRQ